MKKLAARFIISLLLFVGIARGQERLLPDLVPVFGRVGGSESLSNIAIYEASPRWGHRIVSCDDWTTIGPQIEGQRILSFRLSIVNIGRGHLRIREDRGPDEIAFTQLYSVWDGQDEETCSTEPEQEEIARMKIEEDPIRRKFPWASLALYDVAEDGGLGDRVACQVKRACCLMGSSPVRECPVDAPCFIPRAGAGVRHYVDAGARDTYSANFFDQFIPIEGIPSGYYWVEVIANPFGHILESNYENNAVYFMILLDQEADPGTPVEIVDWEEFKCGS